MPLNKNQAEEMGKVFAALPAENRAVYLKSLADNITDTGQYLAVLGQIRPNSPTTAQAGAFMQAKIIDDANTEAPNTIALRLLRGEDMINPPKNKDGTEGKSKYAVPKGFDKNFNEEMSGIFSGLPELQIEALEAVRAYYAALSAEDGDYTPDVNSDRLETAIRDVVGKTTDPNGNGSVIIPYGMKESTFTDNIRESFYDAVIAAGFKIDHWSFGAVTLKNAPTPGQYEVFYGGIPMFDSSGGQIIISATPHDQKIIRKN